MALAPRWCCDAKRATELTGYGLVAPGPGGPAEPARMVVPAPAGHQRSAV